ncbi:MAG: rod shape-determining protein RodA [Holosporales bacterium]|jgi:rod shape determining protein RodA|nr:rod shape-determining protein RodA [Holosporales bacterium]
MRKYRNLSFISFLLKNAVFLTIICLIMLIGVAMQYSAGGGHWMPRAGKHLFRFIVCMGVMLTIALTDQRFWYAWAYWLYIGVLFLLFFVGLWGGVGMGARRWIGLYIIEIQPSEFMKVALVLVLSRYYCSLNVCERQAPGVHITPLLMVAIPSILVLRQPDLGSALILVGAGFGVIFFAGLQLWKIVASFLLGLCSFPIAWMHLHTYQKKRILIFLNPDQDPLGAGYHLLQSKIALGSAGFWGKGFLKGTQSHLNFLPEKHTDFIFAMLCEEFGFLGGSLLLFLYITLIALSYLMTSTVRGYFGRLMGSGLTFLLFLHVFVNIGMVMGLLPIVGVPLSFVSYGGSSMLSAAIALGFVLNIAHYSTLRLGE